MNKLFDLGNWPAFALGEFPDNLPAELQEILVPLHQVSAATLVLVTEHEMLMAIGRDEQFLRKVSQTNVATGISVLQVCVTDSLAMSLCALFSGDAKHVTFRPILNRLSNPKYAAMLQVWHDSIGSGLNAENTCNRLRRIQRRLGKQPLKGCLKRLEDLRNQGIAHYNHAPEFAEGWPLIKDLSMLVATASNITVTALNLLTHRRLDTSICLKNAKTQARAVTSSIRPSAIRTPFPLATFQHTYATLPPRPVDDSFMFYEDNYDLLGNWILQPGKKHFLGDKNNRQCRFCGRRHPEVSFKKEAHAIPESLGNKGIFSYYECDACNELFGTGIENDFGNWSKPIRTMTRIRGKNGVPTIKRHDGGWRIEDIPGGLYVDQKEDDPAFEVDEENKRLTFKLMKDPYTPVAVLKAFVKMGLTLLPDEEMVNFKYALEWVKNKDHSTGNLYRQPIIHTFMPGPLRNDILTLMILRRKSDSMDTPYMSLVMIVGQEMFQIFLPTPERDQHIVGKSLPIYRFPSLLDFKPSEFGDPQVRLADLNGTAIVKGEVVNIVGSFDNKLPTATGDSFVSLSSTQAN